ncbi:MAG: hypothetical protein J0L67_00385 [Cytophagales bacterium]|nr:hypothetical protein [Cytophagales bacterium]
MRGFRNIILATLIALAGGSCFEQPEFSNIPVIEFESLTYKRVNNVDSLILRISFTDGDGDLGLAEDDQDNTCQIIKRERIGSTNEFEDQICLNNKLYALILDSNKRHILIDKNQSCNFNSLCYNSKFFPTKEIALNTYSFITYKDRRTNPEFASLPSIDKPFNCTNWEITTRNNVADTLFFNLNENHINFEYELLVKNPDNTFTPFDFNRELPSCLSPPIPGGRFQILYSDRPGSPLEGEINYRIGSPALRFILGLKVLKFKVWVRDRALNKSLPVYSNEFSLN